MMLAAMVLVGSTVVASDIIGQGMSPFQATALRFAVAGIGFAVVFRVSGERLPRLGRRDWTVLFAQAAAGSFAYSILLIVGLHFTAGANAGVIVGTLPAVMGVLAVLVLGERLTRRRGAALALATVAVAAVTLVPGETAIAGTGWRAALGTAIILAAVGCEAVFLLLNRILIVPVSALGVSAIMCAFGFVLSAASAAVELIVAVPPSPSPAAVWGALYYGIVPTLIGFPLWYGGAQRARALDASLAAAMMPVAAVVLSALVLGERIGFAQAIGCTLVVSAIAIGARDTRRAKAS